MSDVLVSSLAETTQPPDRAIKCGVLWLEIYEELLILPFFLKKKISGKSRLRISLRRRPRLYSDR